MVSLSLKFINKLTYPFDITYLYVREDNYFSFTTKSVTNNNLVFISNNVASLFKF